MVAFEANAPKSGKLTLAVIATPGTCKTPVKEQLPIAPLETWNESR
jgi:hypothetical protein